MAAEAASQVIVTQHLAASSSARVLLVDVPTREEPVVVKQKEVREASADAVRQMATEVSILAALDHPNIVRHFDSVLLADHLAITTEYLAGGSLAAVIDNARSSRSRLDEDFVLQVATQLGLAIHYLHRHSILHRDIKPENVLLAADGHVKLSGFALAAILSKEQPLASDLVGAPYYFAPELFANEPYGPKADAWAFGVTLYMTCARKLPFKANSLDNLAKTVVDDKPPPLSRTYSRTLRSIVRSLLVKLADERASTADILRIEDIRARARSSLSPSSYHRQFKSSPFVLSLADEGMYVRQPDPLHSILDSTHGQRSFLHPLASRSDLSSDASSQPHLSLSGDESIFPVKERAFPHLVQLAHELTFPASVSTPQAEHNARSSEPWDSGIHLDLGPHMRSLIAFRKLWLSGALDWTASPAIMPHVSYIADDLHLQSHSSSSSPS
ncbi:NEK protein kinase [Thecamonas trahens ATCC 50062]|uniref:non-specific serine/threonine protein kinase n=1 Tax=Thecamonas trahens ATCC 50062 TaxID=461836 RepID=A0A0L0DB13_THETB|nr:NEK protein kinase [Thecamonas trahens ATCC 50062]KNC49522.1 NEK protein kinase [Thecamonas trahens ATCC 50062]|eukprot:XP_013757638.1 NEK protein kinase [Thecamonas trahens ATCC 50062]